jgi:hypothetical protein
MGVELIRAGSPSNGSTVCPISAAGGAAQAVERQRSSRGIFLTIITDDVGGIFFLEP